MSTPPDSPTTGLQAVFSEMRPVLVRRAAALGAGPDAEDVVQDICLMLGSPAGPVANPQAYLMRLVYTAVLDRQRAARRSAARETAWVGPADPAADSIQQAEAEGRRVALDTLANVDARLLALGDPAAAIFRRHRIDGIPQKMLATEFGMGLSTIEKHLRRAYAAILNLGGTEP